MGKKLPLNQITGDVLDRSNHTGTQLSETISDLDQSIENNSAVQANTNKETNATHTGEVVGNGELTISEGVITNSKLSEIPANTIKGRIGSIGTPQDLSPSEVRTIIGFDPNDYATDVQGSLADNSVQRDGDTMTDNLIIDRADGPSRILLNRSYARISAGNQGFDGDAHFGSSGAGTPLNGAQDYGFYCAYNAFRDSDGLWKHSRTGLTPAYRFMAGFQRGSFTWSYSANVGVNDISWNDLMTLNPSGQLSLNGNVRANNFIYTTDTPWANLTLTTGLTGQIQYKRKNGRIIITGSVNNNTSTQVTSLGTLPVAFRPTTNSIRFSIGINSQVNLGIIINGQMLINIPPNGGSGAIYFEFTQDTND